MPPDEIRAQLDRILSSHALAGSDQLKKFLRLVVERALNGQSDLLKEYNLGLEVFQRPPDYDPKVDPIVRVQARRLRSKLDEYYASEGALDPFLIQIPKGAYVPAFAPRDSFPPPRSETRRSLWLVAAALALVAVIALAAWIAKDRLASPANTDRSVAVLPLQMFTEGGSRHYIADQVAEVLTTELAKNRQLRVLSRTTATRYRETKSPLPDLARTLGVRWVVEGGVGVEGNRVYVKLRAVDAATDRKVWAEVLDFDLGELVAVNTRAADRIAVAIETRLRSTPD